MHSLLELPYQEGILGHCGILWGRPQGVLFFEGTSAVISRRQFPFFAYHMRHYYPSAEMPLDLCHLEYGVLG